MGWASERSGFGLDKTSLAGRRYLDGTVVYLRSSHGAFAGDHLRQHSGPVGTQRPGTEIDPGRSAQIRVSQHRTWPKPGPAPQHMAFADGQRSTMQRTYLGVCLFLLHVSDFFILS
jgi:hypothetical protein